MLLYLLPLHNHFIVSNEALRSRYIALKKQYRRACREKEELTATRDRYRQRYVELDNLLKDMPEVSRRAGLTEGSDERFGGEGGSTGGGNVVRMNGAKVGVTRQGTQYVSEDGVNYIAMMMMNINSNICLCYRMFHGWRESQRVWTEFSIILILDYM